MIKIIHQSTKFICLAFSSTRKLDNILELVEELESLGALDFVSLISVPAGVVMRKLVRHTYTEETINKCID